MTHLFKFQESKFHLKQNYSQINKEIDTISSKLSPLSTVQTYPARSRIVSRSVWFDQTRIGIFSVYLDSLLSYHILLKPRLEFSHSYNFEELMLAIIVYLRSSDIFPSEASFYFPLFNLCQGDSSYSFSEELTPAYSGLI